MSSAIWGVVHGGKVVVSEGVELPEGCKVLITLPSDVTSDFWEAVSEKSLGEVWDNAEDDAYAHLLEE